ncbi:Rieske (2Fe-2S) protein [Phaeacidiphilus oryzae]|uniref:Rieske (2Fe-2S) protein n=1 Tax=Phaeacidiphilus oryzae TaxID=348818 RepID=UPI0005672357|nr:Rieske (2Fe-2S) protein [Phaeacidiphilus oryzae]
MAENETTDAPALPGCPARRALLAGAGAAAGGLLLAGCGGMGSSGYGGSGGSGSSGSSAGSGSGNGDGSGSGSGSSGMAGSSPAAGGRALGAASEVPVGGGKVFADAKVVVVQPTAGTYKAYSAVCTHAGCIVDKVAGGTIDCPCHGSRYRVEDGSVAAGPAPAPLAPQKVRVSGGQIRLT